MTDTYVAPGGGEDAIASTVVTPAPVTTPAPSDGGDEVRAAAQRLAARRLEKQRQNTQPSGAEAATPAQESTAQAVDAAPPQEVPGETTERAEPEAIPPIEPPRSWTKEEKAEFATYPREAQEKIARREQERERSVRQSQNEAADKLKGLTAKEQAVELARQQYESALPILLQNLSASYNAEFSDIQTVQDFQRLAKEDPFRYSQWDAQQKQVAAVQQEIIAAQQRQSQEKQSKLAAFIAAENTALREHLPDIAKPEWIAKAQTAAVNVLEDVGFKVEELGAIARGEKDISIHDHRFQRILHEATLYRQEQEQKKLAKQSLKAVPKPPVQRPGVSQPSSSGDAQLQALKQKAFTSGKERDMATYVAARRAAASRTATR